MRDIDMERVNGTREKMLETVKSPVLTHEQKVAAMANLADSLLEVVDLPEGLHDLMDQPIDSKCICDLAEGHAPLRPRYIIPDYKKFMREGSKFLQLDPPKDLFEALNSLLIFYKHVPSVTNFPVYLGALDELLDPFVRIGEKDDPPVPDPCRPHGSGFFFPCQCGTERYQGRKDHPGGGSRTGTGCTEHHDEI